MAVDSRASVGYWTEMMMMIGRIVGVLVEGDGLIYPVLVIIWDR
jgi:hypothetical protein